MLESSQKLMRAWVKKKIRTEFNSCQPYAPSTPRSSLYLYISGGHLILEFWMTPKTNEVFKGVYETTILKTECFLVLLKT